MFSIRRALLSAVHAKSPLNAINDLSATVHKTIAVAGLKMKKIQSFEEFKADNMPSFETVSKEIRSFNELMPIEQQQKIYEDTCMSQYRTYVQVLTSDNDPGRLI